MCNKPGFACKCGRLTPETLKLEVGKTYLDGRQHTWKVISEAQHCKPRSGVYICETVRGLAYFTANGLKSGPGDEYSDLYKEYVEPVVHQRDVVWFRWPEMGNTIFCQTIAINDEGNPKWNILKRETVTYTEQ